MKAFQKVGYEVDAKVEQRPGRKAQYEVDVVMSREAWRLKGERRECV